MKVLIFSGTADGRALSRRLADLGMAVTVCVATEYGAEEQGVYPGVTVLTGRRDAGEMATLLRGYALCIDATHPYAREVTKNIRAACAEAGVPCRRLLRDACPADGAVTFASAQAAAAYLAKTEGNILLAVGSKELKSYAALDAGRLYPRVLPSHEAISACEAAGIPHRNIIAMQGPFTRELNAALLRQKKIAWLVTKDGGREGGFPEKAAAAQETGARLVLLHRPEEQGERFEEIIERCEEMLGCR